MRAIMDTASASRFVIPLVTSSLTNGWMARCVSQAITRLGKRLLQGRVIGSGAPINRRPGGLPIKRGGEVEAAIGVCGAPTDEQDEECARCGIEVLDSSAEKSRDSG